MLCNAFVRLLKPPGAAAPKAVIRTHRARADRPGAANYCLHHGKHQVHNRDLRLSEGPGGGARHPVHSAAIADQQNHHGSLPVRAHAAYPVGKAAPEQRYCNSAKLHIAQMLEPVVVKPDTVSKSIHKKQDIAADDKRQRTRTSAPKQCHDHKTLARTDRRVGGAAQPQNKAQHGQPHHGTTPRSKKPASSSTHT